MYIKRNSRLLIIIILILSVIFSFIISMTFSEAVCEPQYSGLYNMISVGVQSKERCVSEGISYNGYLFDTLFLTTFFLANIFITIFAARDRFFSNLFMITFIFFSFVFIEILVVKLFNIHRYDLSTNNSFQLMIASRLFLKGNIDWGLLRYLVKVIKKAFIIFPLPWIIKFIFMDKKNS